MKKHVALSNKSLERVYSWCERNEGTALEQAYMDACTAVYGLDTISIRVQLKDAWISKKKPRAVEAGKPYDLAFEYRDTIGRMILDLIKREAICGIHPKGE